MQGLRRLPLDNVKSGASSQSAQPISTRVSPRDPHKMQELERIGPARPHVRSSRPSQLPALDASPVLRMNVEVLDSDSYFARRPLMPSCAADTSQLRAASGCSPRLASLSPRDHGGSSGDGGGASNSTLAAASSGACSSGSFHMSGPAASLAQHPLEAREVPFKPTFDPHSAASSLHIAAH